ncbi:MAG: hypothetical protein RL398_3369 [Planctomycetota bacterium]
MATERRRDAARPPFAARLLAWFDANRRDLPWRRTRDPWAIWVSEVMLQQTRVEAVREPFARFMARFPTPETFAAVDDDGLLAAWRGLGYYRRARLLREGARAVVRDHGGKVPGNVAALAELPGVGAYTCGAVASIAFGHPEPAVDGNVERVYARFAGIELDIKSGAAQRLLRERVLADLDLTRPGDFNQALMELGATVCTPTSPRCEACPVAADCTARRDGRTAQLPNKKAPKAAVEVTARVAVVLRGGSALGYRIPAGEPNAGQVELPGPGILRSCDPDDLADALKSRFAADLAIGPALAAVRHAITHHRITVHGHAADVRRLGELRWLPRDEATPWTTPSRKLFAALGEG